MQDLGAVADAELIDGQLQKARSKAASVGILFADGSDGASSTQLEQAVDGKAGGVLKLIAPEVGGVKSRTAAKLDGRRRSSPARRRCWSTRSRSCCRRRARCS